jgi:hypothetical protein
MLEGGGRSAYRAELLDTGVATTQIYQVDTSRLKSRASCHPR